jgi:mannosyl-oligosaccharide alpha-1,2-mannosidase
MWQEALAGIQTHLLTTTRTANLKIIAELPQGIGGPLSPKMDHLVCFLPGAIALGATGGHTISHARSLPDWTPQKESQIDLARDLMKTCWGMYAVTATGLAPEIVWFEVAEEDLRPRSRTGTGTGNGNGVRKQEWLRLKRTRDSLDKWKRDFVIKPLDAHNLQRPETVESLFVMWRVTGDPVYREWGWKIFRGFMEWTKAGLDRGFTAVGDVRAVPPPLRDEMESFWLVRSPLFPVPFFFIFLSSPPNLFSFLFPPVFLSFLRLLSLHDHNILLRLVVGLTWVCAGRDAQVSVLALLAH